MSALSLKIEMRNQRDFLRNINTLSRTTGKSVKSVMSRQAAIAAGQLVKRYPPSKKLGSGGASERQIGKRAIAQDILGGKKITKALGGSAGIIATDNSVMSNWEASISAGVSSSTEVARVFRNKSGAIYAIEKKLYRPNASAGEIGAHHEKYRNPRTGRVTTGGSLTRNIGRWKFVDKMYVNKSNVDKYINAKAKNVGKLKAGWLWATEQFPGAAKIPQWIKKHPNHGRGVDRMKDNGTGYIEFVNPYSHASRWKNINDFVIASRRRGLVKEVRAALRAEAKKYAQMRGGA